MSKLYGVCRRCRQEKPRSENVLCEECAAQPRIRTVYTVCRRCKGAKPATQKRLCEKCHPVAETRKRTYTVCWHCKKDKPQDSQRVCKDCRSLPAIKARVAAWQASYRARWPERERARLEEQRRRRESVIAHYGGKCVCCGDTELKRLQLDHIYGDGAQHRKGGGGANIIRWLLKRGLPDNVVRVLCGGCHNAVSYYGFCPHNPAIRTERKVIPITSNTLGD